MMLQIGFGNDNVNNLRLWMLDFCLKSMAEPGLPRPLKLVAG